MEIERKFLVSGEWDLAWKTFDGTVEILDEEIIEQYYLSGNDNEIRIRKITKTATMKEEYTLTRKSKEASLRREEEEVELTKTSYIILKMTAEKYIKKRRRKFKYKDLVFTVDIIKEPRQKELMLEIEFNSEEEANSFSPSELEVFFETMREVTGQGAFYNYNLAKILKSSY